MAKSYRFEGRIEEGRGGGAWIAFPYDVREELGTGGQVRVRATVDGVSYRGSLAPMGGGRHVLGIRKATRQQIGKDVGERVEVAIERDLDERRVNVPPELDSLLAGSPRARERFDALSYTHRREHAEHVAGGKKEETRRRRAARVLEQLLGEPG